ncbi:MAG: VWA domain-containing protein [Thermoguttaceae bacterium]|jgi:Ca-activated chloride channel family protein
MMGFRFQDPLWLLLLIPLTAAGLWTLRRRQRIAVLYSSVELLKNLPVTWAQRVKRFLPWVFLAGLALMVIALARPQHGKEEFRIRTDAIAIEMVVDRSGSMRALDFELDNKRASRLAVVKNVFRDFVSGEGGLAGRPDDLIGLIDFGGFVETKCPLTFDHGALLQLLDTVKIPEPIVDSRGNIINARLLQEEQMTAIGDALATAVERLKPIKAKSKIIILLSDGESNAGVVDPVEAVQAAKAYGIKIYTIGIGTTGPVPMPVEDPFGRTVLQSVMVQIDEKALKMIADATGGKYYNAQDTEKLRKIYADIDKLEKTTTEGRLYTEYRELFSYALFPGLGLVLLEMVLACTRFRSLP